MTRLFDILPDISLDVPNANAIMDKILNSCHAKGFVSEDIMDMAPNRLEKENIFHKIKKFTLKIISLKKYRSRKRFVSEGDGGRIKENGH